MKKLLFACLLVASLFAVAAFAETMTGMVTCEKCRHTDAKAQTCAKTCVKNGVNPIFYNTADQKFYTITNPDKAKDHVGHNVTVTGTVDGDKLTIDTLKMAPAKKAEKTGA